MPDQFEKLLNEAQESKDWIIQLRRRLHRHPELMYEEVKTSQVVRETLDELNISYRSPIAQTGVLATLGNGRQPCVALRADMDALPIQEQADIDFRSQTDGKMHACGHDCHTSMLLGAARVLKKYENQINGTVKLLFQPAEEGGAGGKRMTQEGALQNPDVDKIFGIHVWPLLPTGSIGSRPGTFLAAAGSFEITVHGKGGHAAFPHECVDPIVTASQIVNQLQTIISRETDPLDAGVISVSTIHGGDAHNVIPPSVRFTGTIRALTVQKFGQLQTRLGEIAQAVAQGHGCEVDLEFPDEPYPPTINDASLWQEVRHFSEDLLGPEKVEELSPVMGGEDFAFYTEHVPGCFVALGVRNEDIGAIYHVHHPKFKVDEAALPIGAALHACFALNHVSSS